MDPRCRVEMLGPLRVVRGDEIWTRFGTQKAAALLAWLALRLGPQPRERIIDEFWPDMDLAAGRNNLNTALSGLRRVLEPPGVVKGAALTATHAAVGLNPAVVTTDVAEFERLLDRAEGAAGQAERADLLARAVALYRGEFQAGNYQDWAVREAERLAARHVGALDRLADVLEALGRHTDSVEATQRRLDADPYAEEAHVGLIRRHVLAGQTAAANEARRKFEQFFEKEFGTGPSPVSRRAIEAVFEGAAAGAAPPKPPARSPMPILFPPEMLTTEEAGRKAVSPSAALPFWLSRFIGREAEMARLAGLLARSKETAAEHRPDRPVFRLVTLTGPGGAGKTRLAAEFSRLAAERFGHWCAFVPLADLVSPEQIPAQIVHALRLPAAPVTAPLEQALAFFQSRDRPESPPMLLVLDNLEHLLDEEHGGYAAEVVHRLLTQTVGLSVLCTSRRLLGLQGERLLPLGPLPVPDAPQGTLNAETLRQLSLVPSVRLYVDRAQAARADFGLTPTNAPAVAALCRALEGSPLALELAASWVRLLPPRKMWERLAQGLALPEGRNTDLPERHRSLWAVLEWSWRLLTPTQRLLLARLSVFRGGWNLEAAEIVCGEPDALERLADLVEASLVMVVEQDDAETRYLVLETVRAFGGRKLAEMGEAEAIRKRHADHMIDLARQAESELRGPDQADWLSRLEAEHDNLRAALDWRAADPNAAEDGLRLAATLGPFWRARGHLREGRERLARLLNAPQAGGPTGARADALNVAGVLTTLQTDYAEAITLHEQALDIARRLGDAKREADALHGVGSALFFSQNYSPVRGLLEESLRLRRCVGDAVGEAASAHSLASLALREMRLAEARCFYDQALRIRERQQDVLGIALTTGGLGQVAMAEEDYDGAAHCLRKALRLFSQVGQQWTAALCLTDLSRIADEQGRALRAARLLGAASTLRERFGFHTPPPERIAQEERVAELRERTGTKDFDDAWAAGRAMTWDEAFAYALNDTM